MAKLLILSARWCGPCTELKEELTAAGVPFSTLDVDSRAGGRLADQLGVEYVPAVFVRTRRDYVPVRARTSRGIAAALRRHRGR